MDLAKRKSSFSMLLICYGFFLALSLIICCQFDFFIGYAIKARPYASLFTSYAVEGLRQNKGLKIIYFGDSSTFAPIHKMDDVRTTSSLLEKIIRDQRPDLQCNVKIWGCICASAFDYYCLLYKGAEFSPDLIIIPINLYFVSGTVSGFPALSSLVPFGTRHSQAIKDPLQLQGISSLKQLDYKLSTFLLYPIGFRKWAKDTAKNMLLMKESPEDEAIEEHTISRIRKTDRKLLIERNRFDISRESKNVLILQAIADLAVQKNLTVLFYVSPIDWEYLQQVGCFDANAFSDSKRVIKNAIRGERIYYLDLSEILADEDFVDIGTHYYSFGRQKIAEHLAPVVLRILAGEQPTDNEWRNL